MGYARNLSGSLHQHLLFAYRHFHATHAAQRKSIAGLKKIIAEHSPDVCCLLEVDKGSLNNAYFNQIHALIDPHYHFYDIENKYGEASRLRNHPVAGGKCNGFIAKSRVEFKKHYLSIGAKRLVYILRLEDELTLIFTHFALRRATRRRQFLDLRQIVEQTQGQVIIMGDFNIFGGFAEVEPLLQGLPLKVLNDALLPTFKFAKFRACLDLCIVSEGLADRCRVRVIPQPYSDHDAVLLEVE